MRPDDLAAAVIAALVERSGVDPTGIEDVYLGCANQAGEDNRNVARMAALLAGLPRSVAGVTINRLCASGLSAVVSACHAVAAGDGELFVAGGVESMSRAPLVLAKPTAAFPRGDGTLWDTTLGWRFPNPRLEAMFPLESMGETGENVAERYDVGRDDQDRFAYESQRRHAAAQEAGLFDEELVAVAELEHDEHPRPGTTLEKLASLQPAFRSGGTVTAGNASGVNDGAAALLIASEARAEALGLEPLGTFRGSAVSGVDPRVDGDRARARRAQAARPHRRRGRGDRSGRAQRGLRLPGGGRDPGAGPRPGPGKRQRRGHRHRPPARDVGGSPGRLAHCTSCAAAGGRYWPGDALRRVGQGQAALFERPA